MDSPKSHLELEALFNRALAFHQNGRLAEAQARYMQILERQPAHFDALHLLGLIALQAGETERGFALIRQAIAINPGHAPAHYNLGIGACQLGRYDEAIASFDRALALRPAYAEAYHDRANALSALKRHEEAAADFRRAIAINPGYAEAHGNLGITLHELGQHAAAIASFNRAIELKKEHAPAYNNRGAALETLGRLEEALTDLDQAIALDPHYAEAYYNRGTTLHALRRYHDALASYDRAIACKPDYVEAYVHRGITLNELKRPEESLADHDRAIAINPGFREAHSNRGQALFSLGRFGESARSHAVAFTIDPRGKHALGSVVHALQYACAWDDLGPYRKRIRDNTEPGITCDPFVALSVFDDPEPLLHCAKAYCSDECPPREPFMAAGRRYRHERIKVAYASANWRDHVTARVMVELFETHRRDAFEIIGISFGPVTTDAMRRRLEKSFDVFIECGGNSDAQIAAEMAQREVDIAIDVNGHTKDARTGIFARRPAPIQVNYMGFPGSMGAAYIDYIVGDAVVTPFEHQRFYTEKIVQLPESYFVNDRQRTIPATTPTRRELDLPEQGFVFCCFNSSYKISPELFDIWMRLLKATPDSVLWLYRDNLEAVTNLRREAAKRGVSPDRLVFAPKMEPSRHLARQRAADLLLDTLPYNAHTTATDALWAGVPVLTCPGKTFASRVAASLLYAIGLPELVVRTLDEYEALALRLAANPSFLSSIKTKLAAHRHTAPLFDTERFTRHIERAYQTMQDRHRDGLPAESFAVPPIS